MDNRRTHVEISKLLHVILNVSAFPSQATFKVSLIEHSLFSPMLIFLGTSPFGDRHCSHVVKHGSRSAPPGIHFFSHMLIILGTHPLGDPHRPDVVKRFSRLVSPGIYYLSLFQGTHPRTNSCFIALKFSLKSIAWDIPSRAEYPVKQFQYQINSGRKRWRREEIISRPTFKWWWMASENASKIYRNFMPPQHEQRCHTATNNSDQWANLVAISQDHTKRDLVSFVHAESTILYAFHSLIEQTQDHIKIRLKKEPLDGPLPAIEKKISDKIAELVASEGDKLYYY